MVMKRFDIIVHYKDELTKLQNVVPKGYKYMDLLSDVCDLALSHKPVESNSLIILDYAAEFMGKNERFRLANDSDLQSMFLKNNKRNFIEIFVQTKDALPLAVSESKGNASGSQDNGIESDGEIEVESTKSSLKSEDTKSEEVDIDTDSKYQSDDHSDEFVVDNRLRGSRRFKRGELELQSIDDEATELDRGMMFSDVHAFRRALKEHVIREGFEIVREKNEKARVTARCAADNCPWRIHASPVDEGPIYMVKTYVARHTCVRVDSTREASVYWMASKIIDPLRENPDMKTHEISDVLKEFGLSPAYMQVYRAKRKALDMIAREEPQAVVSAKRSSSMKCGKCMSFGHNKRTCPGPSGTENPEMDSPAITMDMKPDVPLAEILGALKEERNKNGFEKSY